MWFVAGCPQQEAAEAHLLHPQALYQQARDIPAQLLSGYLQALHLQVLPPEDPARPPVPAVSESVPVQFTTKQREKRKSPNQSSYCHFGQHVLERRGNVPDTLHGWRSLRLPASC